MATQEAEAEETCFLQQQIQEVIVLNIKGVYNYT